MHALGALVVGVNRRLEALCLAQAGGESKIAYLPGAAIIFPGRSRYIATYHTLNRHWFCLPHQHAAPANTSRYAWHASG